MYPGDIAALIILAILLPGLAAIAWAGRKGGTEWPY
jgi:hypothetical protein